VILEPTAPTWIEEVAGDSQPADGTRPHVLLISLDTLRADHLGAWGYDRPTSPFLDELTRFGIRFDRVFSQSSKTAPSHMTVFTGAYPSEHGAHFEYRKLGAKPVVFPARSDLPTLAEVMRRAGYRTAAWTGGGQVTRRAGFARGFERYSENCRYIDPGKMQTVRTWFRRHSSEPCFIFLHTYQIHDPYLPPPPYHTVFISPDYRGWVVGDEKSLAGIQATGEYPSPQAAFWKKRGWMPDPSIIEPDDLRRLVDQYDGGIRYTDDVLHGFFEGLHSDGLLDNTIVVLFSDHGEEFLEHGDVLHKMLYRETLHVPLIFFGPAHLPTDVVVEQQVALMDLTPTLLELIGVDAPWGSNARSLLPLIDAPDSGEDRLVYSEEPWTHWKAYHRSYRTGSLMLYDRDHADIELYNLAADPEELDDLAEIEPGLASELLREMLSFLGNRFPASSDPTEPASELSDAEIEALRKLGYVQ
jgi:arylsulfatase A-like enzyme